jgi:two-component system, NarL family, nitrate/nitrite response regulator NarL
MDPVGVLVVSPDPLARSGLAALVSAQPELELAGEAAAGPAGREALRAGARIVLWDMGPGPGDTLDGASSGRTAGPEEQLLVVLCSDEAQAGRALRAGARGVLSRGIAGDALAAALRAVVRGLLVLDRSLAGTFVRPPEPPGATEPLTPREREVLALLAQGLANKAIAARLGISDHTAKFHVNSILGKLGVDSRVEAIVRAARLGLVAL